MAEQASRLLSRPSSTVEIKGRMALLHVDPPPGGIFAKRQPAGAVLVLGPSVVATPGPTRASITAINWPGFWPRPAHRRRARR